MKQRITSADFVRIDANDVRQPLSALNAEGIQGLNDALENGELELVPGLVGWGRHTHTAKLPATDEHEATFFHVRVVGPDAVTVTVEVGHRTSRPNTVWVSPVGWTPDVRQFGEAAEFTEGVVYKNAEDDSEGIAAIAAANIDLDDIDPEVGVEYEVELADLFWLSQGDCRNLGSVTKAAEPATLTTLGYIDPALYLKDSCLAREFEQALDDAFDGEDPCEGSSQYLWSAEIPPRDQWEAEVAKLVAECNQTQAEVEKQEGRGAGPSGGQQVEVELLRLDAGDDSGVKDLTCGWVQVFFDPGHSEPLTDRFGRADVILEALRKLPDGAGLDAVLAALPSKRFEPPTLVELCREEPTRLLLNVLSTTDGEFVVCGALHLDPDEGVQWYFHPADRDWLTNNHNTEYSTDYDTPQAALEAAMIWQGSERR